MLSNKRLVSVCAVVLSFNILVLVSYVKFHKIDNCYIDINDKSPINVISPYFLSFGIDTSVLLHFGKIGFDNPNLRTLTKALSPAHFRLGGTMSECLIFSKDGFSNNNCSKLFKSHKQRHQCSEISKVCKNNNVPFFIMSGKQWTKINEFVNSTNNKLMFSLNAILREENKWSDHNAIELLQYSKTKHLYIDWQLGNEPNSFRHNFNISISPEQLAHDFKHLHYLLHKFGYNSSLIIGPDTTRPQEKRPECLQYMIDFLRNGSRYINVRSWHQYYLNSRTATLEDFWNPKTFDLLKEQLQMMLNKTYLYDEIPMWLSETSSSYGGGANGLSNSYAATPLWLDKLGLSAKYNVSVVVRQSLIGGNYSLINQNMEPLPDWWVSYLYKKLVGVKVLDLNCTCSPYQRMYAHCANRNYTNDTSAITIFGLNLEMKSVRFMLSSYMVNSEEMNIDEYIISAPLNNRETTIIQLNGWPLYFKSKLQPLKPVKLKHQSHITLAPYSIGFWVVKNTLINVCQ